MKRKKKTIHIENPNTAYIWASDPLYFPYCGRYDNVEIEPWEKAQHMEPICKNCLKIMKAKTNLSEIPTT